jgi:nucleotide-binding universal stress UspA family protein
MPSILACTDGSSYAPSIYQHTAWAAQRLSASVEVLHVLDHHRERAAGLDLSGAIGIDATAHVIEELTKIEEAEGRAQRLHGKQLLDDAREQLLAAGVRDVTTTQRHGTLEETLLELEPQHDLVVMGKRGEHTDRDQAHLGGNLERLIRTAVRPVLVAARVFRPIESFLVAYDGGASVTRAIDFVLGSPLLCGAPCHLLRVGTPDAKVEASVEAATARLRAGGHEVRASVLPGEPAAVIAEAIQRERVPLLVMGAYGHSPIRALLLGSTTTALLRTCHVPVLLFR